MYAQRPGLVKYFASAFDLMSGALQTLLVLTEERVALSSKVTYCGQISRSFHVHFFSFYIQELGHSESPPLPMVAGLFDDDLGPCLPGPSGTT